MSTLNPLLDRLGLQYPIIQAPMAGVSTPRMAAAVSNAGGLGSLGVGAGTVAQARQMIEETRALTDKAINVNVFCHAPPRRDAEREAAWLQFLAPLFAEVGAPAPTEMHEIYNTFAADEAMANLMLELRPAAVSFHFGLPPAHIIKALHGAGIVILASATSPQEAALLEEAGVDAIVAQGIEAGGHRGTFDPEGPDERFSTSVLLRLLARQSKLPIIAAGGIMDGAGIKAALDQGAAAAQLGTAFILCPESSASAAFRDNLKSPRAGRTELTAALSGRLARGMVNRLFSFAAVPGSPDPAAYPVAYDAAKQLHAAAAKLGNHEFAAHWVGQGAPLAREMAAGELVHLLVEEWRRA